MEFALDRWITKHNAWIDVFGPNYMRWIFRDVKVPCFRDWPRRGLIIQKKNLLNFRC